jgi:hypothetical protein
MRLAHAAFAIALVVPAYSQDSKPQAKANTRFAPAIESLASKLESKYTIPQTGAKYAATLRANLRNGAYDQIHDPKALAERLTSDLRAVATDGHLRVDVDGDSGSPAGPPPENGGPGPRIVVRRGPGPGLDRFGPPISDAKWVSEGVAYIAFTSFPGDDQTVAAVDRFMKEHAGAKALIIDGRKHHGGGLAEMDVLFSYLFARKTTLVDMDVSDVVARDRGLPMGNSETLVSVSAPAGIIRREHIAIPNESDRRWNNTKVYYLTSSHTASAAEHLALAFKHTHRATLVGETTAGGNHFGAFELLGEGLVAFIPVGRTFDPDTGKDWEGTGIEPDVKVPADQALDTALRLIASK